MWTRRTIPDLGGQTLYTAQVLFVRSQWQGEEVLICRSVLNHNDSIMIETKKKQDGHIYLSDSRSSNKLEDFRQTALREDEIVRRGPCRIRFVFAKVEKKYYVSCSLADNSNVNGYIKTHECESSLHCANSFKKLKKQPSCVTILADNGPSSYTSDNWYPLKTDQQPRAGTAVCSVRGDENQRSAVEYFLSASSESSDIHFSLTEIQLEDLIWLDPVVLDSYFISETLQFTCHFHDYGFSRYPVVIITSNGIEVYKRKVKEYGLGQGRLVPIQLNFHMVGEYTVGEYKIHCIAPVWNTTAWANKTQAFTVKEIVPPYFENDFEILNVTSEAVNDPFTLNCDAFGEPQPTISWNLNKTMADGSGMEGPLLLLRNSSPLLTNGTIISCNGTNRFNQTAMKRFRILRMNKITRPTDNPNSNMIIVVPVIISAISAGTIATLCYKILKYRRDKALYLTDREIREFREGTKIKVENVITGDDDVVILSDSMPYNTTLDVSKDRICVDFNDKVNLLGSGEYGIVYKGSLRPPTTSKEGSLISIAVKTIRPHAPLEYFKALMSELKILAHVGSHDHIVNLVCAWTSNLRKRELFVGIELCQGSLLEFLQKNRNTFRTFISNVGILLAETSLSETNESQSTVNQNKTLSTHGLIKWAGEIAYGMEYLSTRKVVHGDLAARNILISFDMHAKISDFGLAKQLVNYTYLRLDNCRAPWAWMAPESLRERKFTAMTDTWSYGVVLWELFTLGKHPFSGYTWSVSFLEELERGLRNPKPDFANDDIYKVMIECWRPNPKERPNFHVLKEYFEGIRIK